MIRATIGLGGAGVLVQPLLERLTHRAVDDRLGFGVVQAVLGLALELGLGDEDGEDRVDPFAEVFGGES